MRAFADESPYAVTGIEHGFDVRVNASVDGTMPVLRGSAERTIGHTVELGYRKRMPAVVEFALAMAVIGGAGGLVALVVVGIAALTGKF